MAVLGKLVRLSGDAAVIEKVLRLLQALAQISAAFAVKKKDVEFWMLCRRQFGIGRRYIRFPRFLSTFTKAFSVFTSSGISTEPPLLNVLVFGKWTFMGFYLLLESLSILDVTTIYPTPIFAQTCTLEGNKFWFYSLLLSILHQCILSYQYYFTTPTPTPTRTPTTTQGPKSKLTPPQRQLQQEKRIHKPLPHLPKKPNPLTLLSDTSDLFIPGLVIGWINTSAAFVGFCSVISTLIGLLELWLNS